MLKHSERLHLEKSDFDKNGNLKTGRLLYYFQEVAAAHAEKLHVGHDELMEDNRIWVLSKLRYQLSGDFDEDTEYMLETYPRGRKGVIYLRDYYIKNGSGDIIAAGESQWCIINFETRKIERADLKFGDDFITQKAIPEGIEKIKLKNPVYAGEHKVGPEDLDINEHTNNCRYADMLEDITGRNDYVDFSIHFAKEARLGDDIKIYQEHPEESDDRVQLFMGKLEDDTTIFQAKVIYRQ